MQEREKMCEPFNLLYISVKIDPKIWSGLILIHCKNDISKLLLLLLLDITIYHQFVSVNYFYTVFFLEKV